MMCDVTRALRYCSFQLLPYDPLPFIPADDARHQPRPPVQNKPTWIQTLRPRITLDHIAQAHELTSSYRLLLHSGHHCSHPLEATRCPDVLNNADGIMAALRHHFLTDECY
jgi:hypothetical protein